MLHETRATHRRRTAVVGLLLTCAIVNYLDRGTMSVAAEQVRMSLGLSLGQLGLLMSAFSWSYAPAQLPAGVLIDRFGPRWPLGLGLLLWSLAQAAGGFSTGFAQLLLARLMLGVGEATQFPAAASVAATWFAPNRRGIVLALLLCCAPLGLALSPLCIAPLVASAGWRRAFVWTGAAGLLLALLWLLVHPRQSGLPEAAAAPRAGSALREWGRLFRYPCTWGVMCGALGAGYVFWVFAAWLPSYLQLARHMTLRQVGVAAALPFLCGVVGSLGNGYLSDRLGSRARGGLAARRRLWVAALLGMAGATVLAASVADDGVALACISVAMLLTSAASCSAWTMSAAFAPPGRLASLVSIQNAAAYVGATLAPMLTGFIAQAWSFTPALLAAAALAAVCAIGVMLLVRRAIEPEAVPA